MRFRIGKYIGGMALAAMFAFGAAQSAHATNYTCANVPTTVTGDAIISQTPCTISHAVTASGQISVSSGSTVSTKALTANGGPVTISASTSAASSGAITASSNVSVTAGTTISVTSVTASNGPSYLNGPTGVTVTSTEKASTYVDNEAANGTVTWQGNVTATSTYIYGTAKDITSTGTSTALKAGTHVQLIATDKVTMAGPVTSGTTSNSSDGNVQVQAPNGITLVATTAYAYADLRALSGTLQLNGALTTQSFSGYVYLDALNIDSNASGSISSGYYIQATDSIINTINIQGPVSSGNANGGQGGNILLFAQGNIATGAITLNGLMAASGAAGSLDIKANMGGANVLFTINGSGSNGVNGTITEKTASGGGGLNYYATGGVFITNGTGSSTGGITVDTGAFSVTATGSRNGSIILNAQNGTLTLASDGLNVAGASGQMGGYIELLANTINAPSGTTLNASQGATVDGSNHWVLMAATSITYGGAGLTINDNGNGATSANGLVYIVPQNYISLNDNEQITGIQWSPSFNGSFASYSGQVNVGVSSGAPLNVTANGTNNYLGVSGYPLTIGGTNVELQSQGSTVYTGYYNAGAGSAQLTFSNTGTLTLDASAGAIAPAGGTVVMQAYTATISTPTSFTVNANGPSNAAGNGGIIDFYVNGSSTFSSTYKAVMTANASSNGTGNAVYGDPTTSAPLAISFFPGTVSNNITLGTGNGQFAFSANGGSTGGNAGTIAVGIFGFVDVQTASAVTANALAGNGNGGWIYINNYLSTFANNPSSITAKGFGTGIGGKVFAYNSVAGSFNVTNLIKVNAGASAPVANFDGSIELNGITCQQWKTGTGTGQTTWLSSWWDCANPGAPTANEINVSTKVNLLPPSFITTLGNNNVVIYVFNIASDYNTFFNPTTQLGNVYGAELTSLNLAAVFDKILNGANQVDVSLYMKGDIMHELAHLLDAYGGFPSQIAPFSTASAADQAAMIGNYPNLPQSPTCLTVFNNINDFCTTHAGDGNPWISFQTAFIGTQNVNSEMFAFAFQSCSGFGVYDGALDYVETTNPYNIGPPPPPIGYLANVNTYMNKTYWPGGCP